MCRAAVRLLFWQNEPNGRTELGARSLYIHDGGCQGDLMIIARTVVDGVPRMAWTVDD